MVTVTATKLTHMRVIKINLLPIKSLILGTIKEAEAHPMKYVEPIKPRSVFDTHARSSYSTQL